MLPWLGCITDHSAHALFRPNTLLTTVHLTCCAGSRWLASGEGRKAAAVARPAAFLRGFWRWIQHCRYQGEAGSSGDGASSRMAGLTPDSGHAGSSVIALAEDSRDVGASIVFIGAGAG